VRVEIKRLQDYEEIERFSFKQRRLLIDTFEYLLKCEGTFLKNILAN